MRVPRVSCPLSLALAASLQLPGQMVVSVHSGVLHFSEGQVFINDAPVEQKLGTFPTLKEGSTLRTQQGRAELLMTPGVFLRMDESSSIRMVSTALKDTRVDFLEGSVIIDSLEATADDSVLITYKDNRIRFPQKGVCRLDSEPPILQVYNGEAEVTHEGKPYLIDPSHLFFFSLGLTTQKFGEGADDDFSRWSKDRSDFISADNRAAAQSAADPADSDGGDPLARDPGLYLGSPSYGGSPTYDALNGGTLWPYNSLMYSNVPFGIGASNLFATYFVYVPLYLRGRTAYPGRLPPTHIGISTVTGRTYPIITPRGVTVARPVPIGRIASPRVGSVTAPRVGATHVAPMGGHR